MSTELQQDIFDEEQEEVLDEYLSFVSDDLRFAVSARYVTEIITSYSITILPQVPDYVKGIFNLRGQVLPIIDARVRMRQAPNAEEDGKCVIVLNTKEGEVAIGFLVDGVSHVVNISDEEILPPPANSRQELVSGIAHIDNDDYLILNCDKLLEKSRNSIQ